MEEQGLVNLLSLCIYYTVSSAQDGPTLLPFGTRMCERLCQRTVGCHRFLYSSRYLSCHLQPEPATDRRSDASHLWFDITQDKLVRKEKSSVCPSASLMYRSKRNVSICRLIPNQLSDKRQMTRLLLAGNQRSDVTQYFLKNGTFSTYINDFEGVKSLAYIECSNMFLFIVYETDRLMMSSMEGKNQKSLSNAMCWSFCVTQKVVFFLLFPKTLSSMSHFGTNIRSIKSIETNAPSMAADMNNNLLYLLASDGIIVVYDYHGEKMRQIGDGIHHLYIQPYSKWLFYARGNEFIRLSLVNNSNAPLIKKKFFEYADRICVYNDVVYGINTNGINQFSRFVNEFLVLEQENVHFRPCCFIP